MSARLGLRQGPLLNLIINAIEAMRDVGEKE